MPPRQEDALFQTAGACPYRKSRTIFPEHALREAPTERWRHAMAEAGNTLTLETTKGPVVIEMRPDLAPQHVAHIKKLVDEHFYDGVAFHRVIDGFMAQTGCPHGTGTGGSK